MSAHETTNGDGKRTAETQAPEAHLPARLVRAMNSEFTAARAQEIAQRRQEQDPIARLRYHELMADKLLEGVNDGY